MRGIIKILLFALMCFFCNSLQAQLRYLHTMKNTYFSVIDSTKYSEGNKSFFPKYNLEYELIYREKEDTLFNIQKKTEKTYNLWKERVTQSFLKYNEDIIYTDSLRPKLYDNTFFELFKDSILIITFLGERDIFNHAGTVYRKDCFILKYTAPDTIYHVHFNQKRILRNEDDLNLWNLGSNTSLTYAIKEIDLNKSKILLLDNKGNVEELSLTSFKNPFLD